MRQRFEQQNTLGITAIPDVKFPLRSRDELPPVLKSLHYIFTTPELNEKVFSLLEEVVCKDKKQTGRKGMDLWHILVLAVVRHTLSTNWDRMEDMAANHRLIRQVMGIHVEGFGIVFLEAGMHQIPVIGGRTGGVVEAIINERTGYLINPKSRTELEGKMIELYKSSELRTRMGKQARTRVINRFNDAPSKALIKLLS